MRNSFYAALLVQCAGLGVHGPAHAQACDPDVARIAIDVQAEYAAIRRDLRKAAARADGQELLVRMLPDDLAGTVPARPDRPAPLEGFGADGAPQIDCASADGGAGAAGAARGELRAARGALDAYLAAIEARDAAIGDAEARAEARAEPPVAALPPPQDAPDPAAPREAPGSAEAPGASGPEPETEAPVPPVAGAAQAEAADAGRRDPLPDPDVQSLFRRVISLPGTRLAPEPGGSAEDGLAPPVFDPLYVFDETEIGGVTWLEVGPTLTGEADGWIEQDDALAWSTMLVMQFAPRGRRAEVLFFDDVTTLVDLVDSPFHAADAQDYYDRLSAERGRLVEDPGYAPQWDDALVAVEPETAVTFESTPYILPILDWREELFDGDQETVLLQVAALPADAAEVEARDTRSMGVSAAEAAELGDAPRVGVVFVLDTSISMQPFIDRTQETIQAFYDAFGDLDSTELVSFGLVGFRDNVAAAPDAGVDYVSRVVQPLDPDADPRIVLTKMREMRAATGRTSAFREDGLAGLTDAVQEMDWGPFGARLVVYISDASVRVGADPLARERDLTPEAMAEIARNAGIAVVPIHLLTAAAEEAGDVGQAEAQYRAMAARGDGSSDNYIAIDASDDAAFAAMLGEAADRMARNVVQVAGGRLVSASGPGAAERPEPAPSSAAEAPEPDGGASRLADVITNEVLRAQLESLGDVTPGFLEGWAADRDLMDPELRAMEVSVFLTRNQLSTLDKRIDVIVEAFNAGGSSAEFFDRLQEVAAKTATDPDAVVRSDAAAVRALLPDFLAALPYRSEVLQLDRDFWDTLPDASRGAFIDRLRSKQRVYQDLFAQIDLWKDFGSGDPGLQATPVRLSNLP